MLGKQREGGSLIHEIIRANTIIVFFYYHLSQMAGFTIAQQYYTVVADVGPLVRIKAVFIYF